MKAIFIFTAVLFTVLSVSAQRISPADYKFLQKKEDSLKIISMKIIRSLHPADRLAADSIFTRILVRALLTKNSFYYPFDSVITVSNLYPPDSSFRIYTWQLQINDNVIRQHGAIQMRTQDGSFKKFVLIDKSDIIPNTRDTIVDNVGWIGAVYYKIIQKGHNGRTFYTLFGFDENNMRTDKKMMDILEFVDGKPVFGNKLFVTPKNNANPTQMARFIMEYKNQAAPRLNYDPALDAVIFDELISDNGNINDKSSLVPDGEFEGFKWINGKWVHTKNIFGGEPTIKYTAPQTIRDAKGTIDPGKIKGGEPEPERNDSP